MIVWLLKALEKNPASVFRKKDLKKKSESQFERLKHLGLLAFCQSDLYNETYPCAHPCANACPMDVVSMEGQLFAICPEDSEVDPIPLAKDDISKYQFSLDMLIKAIREANNFAGDSYSFSSRMYFMGVQVVEQVSTAFILALFPDVQAAEPHLLSLPTRIAANYQRVVVITPSLSLTQEPIYAKLRTASIFPVTLPSSFGQDNYKISYVAALRKPLLAGIQLETYESAKRIAEAYGINVRRVRSELSKEYWGPGGSKADNPLRPQLRTAIEDAGGKDVQYLWQTELVKPILEKLTEKHIKKH